MTHGKKVTSIQDALEALDAGELGAKSKEVVKKVDVEVRKNPWVFVGIAAFFAAVIGFFLGRKSKD